MARRNPELMDRVELGERMLQWHGGQNDPVYAVGSFYLSGKQYPDQEVVEDALANLEAELEQFERMRAGERVMVRRQGKMVDLRKFAGYKQKDLEEHAIDLSEIVDTLREQMVEDSGGLHENARGATRTAGFAIETWDQDLIEAAAEEAVSGKGVPSEFRRFVHTDGTITQAGWTTLNKDVERLEINSMNWLKHKFEGAQDEGHNNYGELAGTLWYDPKDKAQLDLLDIGQTERLDMVDSSYGDLAKTVWNGVSGFGQGVLGGAIHILDVEE